MADDTGSRGAGGRGASGGRRVARRLAVVLAASAAALAAVEVAARVAFDPPRYFATMPFDAALGWRMELGGTQVCRDADGAFPFVLSAEGFRGPDLPDAPPGPGERRVVLVGDSFLAGWEVRSHELLSLGLPERMAARGVAGVRAYALCCDGYGTAQELLLWRRHGPDLAPDTVVLCVYPGNDLFNNSPALYGEARASEGDLLRPYLVAGGDGALRRAHPEPWRAALRGVSRAFALVERRRLAQAAEHRDAFGQAAVEWPARRLERGLPPTVELELFTEPAPGSRWEDAWRHTADLLRAFRDEVEATGARFVVAAIPTRDQVQRDAFAVFQEWPWRRFADAEPALDRELPERRLAALLAAEGVEFVPLLPALRAAAAAGAEDLWLNDGHLSGAGHAVAGAALADRLAAPPAPADAAVGLGRRADLLGPEDGGALDLTRAPHYAVVGPGWRGWRPAWGDAPGGWAMRGQGFLALRPAEGELVVEGTLPPGAPVPVRLGLGPQFGPEEAVVLDAPGPFVARVAFGSPVAAEFVPLMLTVDGAAPFGALEARPVGLVLHRVRFEAP